MNSPIWFETMSLGWFIVYMKGSQARFSKLGCTAFPEEDSYQTNSTDPDELPHNVAFHLGLHCLPKISFKSSPKISEYCE